MALAERPDEEQSSCRGRGSEHFQVDHPDCLTVAYCCKPPKGKLKSCSLTPNSDPQGGTNKDLSPGAQPGGGALWSVRACVADCQMVRVALGALPLF